MIIIRIIYFTSLFKITNKRESYYYDIVNSLVEKYPDVEFLVYTINCEKNEVIKINKNILWIKRRNLKNLYATFLFLKDIKTLFIKFNPDILHSLYLIESIIMGILGKIFKIPSIFHGRGVDINYTPFISLKQNIKARIGCKLNNKIITVSKDMKRNIMNLNVPEKKITWLYNGVDLSLFRSNSKKWEKNIDIVNLIHIGRYSPEKRQEMIIEVCKELKKNGHKFHLTLIGYGPLEKYLKLKIKELHIQDKITMKGFVPHSKIPLYLRKAHIYIQTSITEGIPNSVLEAMSMQLVIIMTKAGGMPELKNPPGTKFIEVNNNNQLFDAIIEYINKPDMMKLGGKSNREFVLKNFTWDHHASKLYSIYNQLLMKNQV
mgnify:CR=1 FL=1